MYSWNLLFNSELPSLAYARHVDHTDRDEELGFGRLTRTARAPWHTVLAQLLSRSPFDSLSQKRCPIGCQNRLRMKLEASDPQVIIDNAHWYPFVAGIN